KESIEDQIEDTGSTEVGKSQLDQAREEQLQKDTLNYNYIFSQGNRASFFANRESKENVFLTVAKNYERETTEPVALETYEKAFDFNRKGEFSIYINPEAAYYNFLQALSLFVNDESTLYSEALLDSVVAIRSVVGMDTLSIEEKYALGKTMANLSILIHARGKYNLSEDFISETTKYIEDEIGTRSIALASLYNNHAVIAQSQGKYTEAEEYFDQSEAIVKKNGKAGSVSHAIIKSNRALLYNEVGQYDQAISEIENSKNMASGELRSKGRDNISFKINEGLIHYSKRDYEREEVIFNEVLELKRKRMARNQTDYANVENYLAGVLMESDKTDQVPELLNDALRIFEKKYTTNHPAYIKTKHNLGKYHLYSGDFVEASNILNEVNRTYQQFYGVNHPDYLNSLEDLAVVSWKQGLFSQATTQFKKVIDAELSLVENYFGAMSEYEKGQYWAKVRPTILKFYAYAVERGIQDPSLLSEMYTIHLKTKGILLSTATKVRTQILNSSDEKLKQLYADWVQAKEELILYYTYSKAQLAEQKIDLEQITSNVNRIEKALNQLSSEFAQSNKLPVATISDVRSRIGANDVAVEVIGYPVFDRSFTDKKNYAFLIARQSSEHPELVVLEEGNDLDRKYAKAYLNRVKLKAEDKITYEKFWQPIDEKLGDVDNVYLSPDGVYYQVNVGALERPDGTFVSDELKLHLYSSTRDLTKKESSSPSRKQADFFGFPDYGAQGLLQPLPGTQKEIATISKLTESGGFATRTFMRKEASEQNFKEIRSPSLLHVATHGFFLKANQAVGGKVFGVEVGQANDNPLLRSGLMLADAEQTMRQATQGTEVSTADNGVLTAYEVVTLDLKNTELVVLSACETGLGEVKSGEGVYGLQRAFQVAGAASVVMSLWKVSDEATQQLMTSFYEEWMSGKPREEAFFTAQKSLRQRFPEPYYWGAFVMLN
ncbi:MAG: CHAT domain-containing tetratricopeptide repeat protein, partial [Bacteroidota bacterium]